VHNDTPIVFLGGHTHVRDCRMLDDRTLAVESGRYFETFGFASVKGIRSVGVLSEQVLRFARRYIDANTRNLAFHAGLHSAAALVTDKERFIRRLMRMISRAWGLDELQGVVPEDYYLERFQYGHVQSLLSLLSDHVLPTVVRPSEPTRSNVSSLILINSFSQRHDVLMGPFTTNEKYIVSPFRDRFKYIRDVPWKHASALLERLNRQKSLSLKDSWRNQDRRYGWGFIDDIFDAWQGSQWAVFSRERRTGARKDRARPSQPAAATQESAAVDDEARNDAATTPQVGGHSALHLSVADPDAPEPESVEVDVDGTTFNVEALREELARAVDSLPPGTTKAVLEAVASSKLPSLGYKTQDGCEGEGDDTEHTPITFSSDQPTYVASYPDPAPSQGEELVDVVL